ncbi:MAG: hypothetical protein Q9174_003945 [Haloplaca sp. 1 TL-2023]
MSGAELFLATLGVVIPTIQAAITAKGHSAQLTESRSRARDMDELYSDVGPDLFSSIYSSLRLYETLVEPELEERDRFVASNLRKSILNTVKKSRETAQEYHNARQDRRCRPAVLRAVEDKLQAYAMHLNNLLLSILMFASRILLSTRSLADVAHYGDDPVLEMSIREGDVDMIESLLTNFTAVGDRSPQYMPATRPSLALLLACRRRPRLPKVVQLSLDLGADPNVIDEDGLGAIHNVIGTADVSQEPSDIVDILNILSEAGIQLSVPDSTETQLRPLHRAVIWKMGKATKFLLDKDPEMVNLVDAEGRTALHHACATPDQKITLVQDLVHFGASFAGKQRPPMPDRNGRSIARYLDGKGLK